MGTLFSMSAVRNVVGLLNLTPRSLRLRNFSTNTVNMGKAYVVGVGMTKFEKPGRRENFDYPDMAKEAVENALADAGLKYTDVEQACVGYVYGDSTCGQRALYPLGMTGIPVYNVNNNCATWRGCKPTGGRGKNGFTAQSRTGRGCGCGFVQDGVPTAPTAEGKTVKS